MVRTVDVPVRPAHDEQALADLVADAVRDGIIFPEQAERMLSRASGVQKDESARGGRLGVYVAEALGYVGAALVLVAGGPPRPSRACCGDCACAHCRRSPSSSASPPAV